MNNITISGNLTRDPELKFLPTSNKAVANATVAVSRKYDKDKTDFINIVAWGSTAEKYLAKYAKKGTKVLVSGELHIDKWTDKEGNTKYKSVVNVSDVEILDGWTNNTNKDKQDTEDFNDFEIDDDEIPF